MVTAQLAPAYEHVRVIRLGTPRGRDAGRRRHAGRRPRTEVARTSRLAGPAPPAPLWVWAPCQTDSAELDLPKDAQCGDLTVPVDYADPDGGTATLALLRVPGHRRQDRLAGD